MPRVCTICSHPEREAIDAAIVAGEPLRSIAERFGTSATAMHRHKADHLPAALAAATEAATVAHGDNLLGQVRDLQSRALGILGKAEDAGDLRTALAAIREARGNLELLARLLGELQDTAVHIHLAPEWVELRAAILVAVAPYPEARRALLEVVSGEPTH